MLAAGLALVIYAVGLEPGRLEVESTTLAIDDWSPEHAGLRIAVLTDLHVGAPHIDLERLADVVDATNTAAPDVVVILGDLVIHGVVGGDFVEPEPIAAELGRLRAKHVVAVLGNHDWWYDGARIIRALEGVGIPVLEDRALRLEGGAASGVWIAGISDLWTRDADIDKALAAVDDDGPVVAITHNPDVFVRVPDRVALTLAGHTHGGQIDLPWFGAPVVPSDHGQRFAQGHVVEGGRDLFVGTGIGTSIIPVRLGVVPRIDVLTLVPGNR